MASKSGFELIMFHFNIFCLKGDAINNYSNIIFRFGLLKKPLQRMTVGGILTAASFFISGFLELELQKTYANVSFPTKVKRLL